jgi:titin
VYDVGGSTPDTPLYDGVGTVYEQTGLTAGTEYSYKVSALSAAGESDKSDVLDQAAPAGPASALASSHQSSTAIMLEWTAPTVATGHPVSGYRVYQRVVHELSDLMGGDVPDAVLTHFFGDVYEDNVVWSEDTEVYDGTDNTDTNVQVTGLSGGTLYEFVVGPLSLSGEGDRGTSVVQSTAPSAPAAPTASDATTSSLVVTFAAVAVPSGEPVTDYNVYRDDGLGGSSTPSILATTSAAGSDEMLQITVDSLAAGRTYRIAVTAVSLAGESPQSDVIEATTASG